MYPAVAYVRVSTVEQDEETQIYAISEWARERNILILRWYIDKVSGASSLEERPMLRKLISEVPSLEPRPIFFLTYDISRLARSIEEFFNILNIIENRLGLIFIPVRDLSLFNISPELRPIMRTLLAVLAELEREIIRRRTRDSMRRVKQCGKNLNIIEKLLNTDPKILVEICEEYEKSIPMREIARRRGLTYYAVWRIVHEYCKKNSNVNTCTRCGHKMHLENRIIIEEGNRIKIREIYYCKNCGNRIERELG